jgi:hypothetical protein
MPAIMPVLSAVFSAYPLAQFRPTRQQPHPLPNWLDHSGVSRRSFRMSAQLSDTSTLPPVDLISVEAHRVQPHIACRPEGMEWIIASPKKFFA